MRRKKSDIIKGEIIERLDTITDNNALELIKGFLEVVDKGTISHKCKKAGDPFYSREFGILNLYEEAIKAKGNIYHIMYEGARFIRNMQL